MNYKRAVRCRLNTSFIKCITAQLAPGNDVIYSIDFAADAPAAVSKMF